MKTRSGLLGGIGGFLGVVLCVAAPRTAWGDGDTSGGAKASAAPAAAAPYVDPAPIRVYRFYVYAAMKQRKNKTVTVDSLVKTSASDLIAGDRAVIERRLEPSSAGGDWKDMATVVVRKILPRGRIEVQVETEGAEASVKRQGKSAFAPGQKVRLRVDRVLPPA